MNKKTKRQLEIMTKAIGDKDRLIFGHSERVFAYAQINCRELGLSVGKALLIECAAILHDLGKISVREKCCRRTIIVPGGS
ncbi:MAG TPA: hypothetical protein DCQ14_06085 [Firmicutes bacterium]|nr:hypothetical protein [Bacillota bacterium]